MALEGETVRSFAKLTIILLMLTILSPKVVNAQTATLSGVALDTNGNPVEHIGP